MKKMIFLVVAFAAILFTTLAATAQVAYTSNTTVPEGKSKALRKENREAARTEVSSRTLKQFATDFPGAKKLSSSRVYGMNKIVFTQNGIRSEAYYDNNSSLIGSTTAKTVADIPPAAIKRISRQYKDYTIGKVLLYKDNESNENDMTLYGEQFASSDNYFAELNKNGKRIIIQITPNGDTYYFKTL